MLTWIFLAGAVICLLYFFTIVIYAGITTASAVIWLIFAGFLLAADLSLARFIKSPESIPLRLPVTMITLCTAGMVILLILEILIFSRIPSMAEPDLDYVIVLGSSVKEDGPGKVLAKRLDKALEYADANPSAILVLSGGKDGFDPVSEASSMRDYLVQRGMSEDKLILEDESKNTVENIRFSFQKIDEAEEMKQSGLQGFLPEPRVGVLTSNFHLYRAMKIAEKQGKKGVSGIAAPCDGVLLPHLSIRDALAILKDRLAGNL